MSDFLPIGERLKEERNRLGMNQGDFCALAGITRKTLFGYETGVRAPDAGALSAWAAAGLDVLYVVTGQRTGSQPALNRRESALLDNYRHCSHEGQAAVEQVALVAAKPQQDLLNKERGVKTAS